jgi:Helix-turn-helix domain
MGTQPLRKDRKQYVTVEEAQILINRSERTIRRWITQQRVHVIRDASGFVRIDLDDLEQFREQQPPTVHPVQQHIQLHNGQIEALEDRCARHEQHIEVLQQRLQHIWDLLQAMLNQQPLDEDGEFPADRLLSLLATLNIPSISQKKEPMHPEKKRGLPTGTQRLVHFVELHQVNLFTLKQLFWSKDIQLTIYQRLGDAQRNKQEWWITPEQHRALAHYCRHHGMAYTTCEECQEEGTEAERG